MPEEVQIRPDYIFEVSWEICNKVGGIHTVIATKALSLVKEWEDKYILIGPDVWKGTGEHPEFSEDPELFPTWKARIAKSGLKVRIGRWKITGNPLVVLIDFTSLFVQRNEIFKNLWLDFHVDSLSGQWDYIEPALFGYAAGQVIECFYDCHLTLSDHMVAHFHEWLTAAGVLYLEKKVPQAGTIFTTHATVTGRTIAGNEQPFYSRFDSIDADMEARKWNVISKHSLEKAGARYSDCFTTVSETTARECEKFLGRSPDVITINGFDDAIVPDSYLLKQKRSAARKRLFAVAQAVTGTEVDKNSLLILKSGRYEFRNKGVDVFIEAISRLQQDAGLKKNVVAFICIPAHHTGPREYIQDRMAGKTDADGEKNRLVTHHLQGMDDDRIVKYIRSLGLKNESGDRVKIIFVPAYLDGHDGIMEMTYYDLLPGFDLSAFPSYYEPWGYTPLESLAFHIPSITTDLAGFGQFIKGRNNGVFVLHRDDDNREEVPAEIEKVIRNYMLATDEERKQMQESAYLLSKAALWKNLIIHYHEAFHIALHKTTQRAHLFEHGPQVEPVQVKLPPVPLHNKPVWRKIFIQPTFPKELEPLEKLSRNLWWNWNREAIALFESIEPQLWMESNGNPIVMLNALSLARIKRLVREGDFMRRLEQVNRTFELYMQVKPEPSEPLVAYFCMEYGLDTNLRLYSGGLGILAGDYLKEASDSNKRIVGVGLLYRKGYFRQQLALNGDQLAMEDIQKFTQLPLYPVRNEEGEWLRIHIAFPGRTLYAKAWRVAVGRVSLYLLDTDIPENRKDDRLVTDHLYDADGDRRLIQELLLGIGGVRLLHALDIHPDIYHSNEGHSAFLGLERIYRMVLEENISYEEALEMIRATTLFTTHTPVAAGHDRFSEEELRAYLTYYPDVLNISWEQLMKLGQNGLEQSSEPFSMSFLAARISQEINGVSRLNEEVSRKVFHPLWEGFMANELHIGHITNGIHYATWIAPEWAALFEDHLGLKRGNCAEDPDFKKKIGEMPDKLIWETHQKIKDRAIDRIRDKFRTDLSTRHSNPKYISESLVYLDKEALYIGFARRSAPYKRSNLVFHDLEKLDEIVNGSGCPVIFIFAGKAHPKDKDGQRLITEIVSISHRPQFTGKILFLEDYDMELARQLVQGVDVWLNTPERGMEASGTSGMKAAINGVLNFSVLDGWWEEAYNPALGWALNSNPYSDSRHINEVDAADIYRILQTEIIPTYLDRDQDGLPVEWIARMKGSITALSDQYGTRRMLSDYFEKYYLKLFRRAQALKENDFADMRELVSWKRKIQEAWQEVRIEAVRAQDTYDKALSLGQDYSAEIEIFLNGLSPEDVAVEVIFIEKREDSEDTHLIFSRELTLKEQHENICLYACKIPLTRSGVYEHGFRLYPKHPMLPHRQDFPLAIWM